MKRPNFILFITDQQRADFLGCYGHPLLKTPHIDSLAANGVAFDRFYVASPVCMPNRASLMTGRMPSVHGVRSNGIPLAVESVTFVDLLRDAGYATGLIGKSHLQNFTTNPSYVLPPAAPPGFHAPSAALSEAVRRELNSDIYQQERPAYWSKPGAAIRTPFYGYEHVELVTGHGDDLGGDYARWLLARAPHARSLLGAKNALPHDYVCPQAVRTAVPPELYSTTYIAERAIEYLRDAGERPIFLTVSFTDPHHPFNPPGHYWDMYDPDDFPVPEAFRRNDWTPPPHVAAAITAREAGRANITGMNTIGVAAREAQEAQALTCGMIACIDDAIGRVLAVLRASTIANDTVVMFTSDHGDHLGEHRLLFKGAEQYQQILRVPFIWSDPRGRDRAGTRSGALASTIDISASVLERAEVQSYAGMQGRSLLPAIAGHGGRDAVFVQYDSQYILGGHDDFPRAHSLIDERWRITLYHGVPWGELYDLERDPGEFDNLWDSAEHAGVKSELLERLARAEIEHVDRVPLPTGRA